MTATFTRRSAWDNGGTLAGNGDLLWYAIGVGQMMKRNIADPLSWWYFAAIHGEDRSWPRLPTPPQVPTPTSPAPAPWNQCQHATWYFPPWHRGYLMALENQLRTEITALGGPGDWALPYWNYFGEQNPPNQFNMPPAFAEQNFPAAASLPSNVPSGIPGSPNPLFVTGRYGPKGDGVIFVPTKAGLAAHPIDPESRFFFGVVTEDCLNCTTYTGDLPDGFGGGETVFEHFDSSTGSLENNPHNLVHSYVGGVSDQTQRGGLMGDPDWAALDPIFYLHHAQVDRLWAVWDVNLNNSNPIDPDWLYGPTSGGEPEFTMPWNDGFWSFTCDAVATMGELSYTYADMSAPTGTVPVAQAFSARLAALRSASAAVLGLGSANVQSGKKVELLGATQGSVEVKGAGARAAVQLDTGVRSRVAMSLQAAAPTALPDRVFLRLDNVVGTVGGVLSVFINLPEDAKPAHHEDLCAGSIGLFGLRQASQPTGRHGGKGLTFTLDITQAVDQLHLSQSFDLDTLHVSLVSSSPVPDSDPIQVGRISIYRQGQ